MNTKLIRQLAASACLIFLHSSLTAAPVTLQVKPGAPNLVTFTSIAPLETIVGKTAEISGSINFDPDNPAVTSSGTIEVDMASLDTDNRVRDGHMRRNHLHSDQYPFSRFTLQSLTAGSPGPLLSGKPSRFKARGSFLCHGVTRDIEPEVVVVWDAAGRRLTVEAVFNVLLSDFAIPRPQFLVMKLDETQTVNVKFTAR